MSNRVMLAMLGIGFSTSSFAAAVMSLAYSYLTYQLTGRASIAVVASACLVLPLAILVKVTGAILRRRSAKTVLVWTNVATIASYIFGTAAIMAGFISVPFLLFMALIAGIGQAFMYPAWNVLLTETAPRDSMEEVNAGMSAWWAAGALLGVLCGGLIQANLGPAWLFVAASVGMVPMVVVLFFVRSVQVAVEPEDLTQGQMGRTSAPSLRQTLDYIRQSPVLWVGLLLMLVNELVGYSLLSVMPALANEVDPSPITYALLMASFYLGLFFVDIWMHRIHRERSLRTLIVIALIVMFVLLVISPILGQAPEGTFKLIAFMILLSPIGLMVVVIETFYESAQQVGGTDETKVPYVLALFSAVGAVIGTIGGFILAAIIDLSNVFPALLLAGLLWGGSLLYLRWARHLQHVDAVSAD
ncbi:MAG: MFS transporter [Actinomycetales bacterium]|nr:MFS transporter [Actinomycetales bacterium]